jgi:hypothetical protein
MKNIVIAELSKTNETHLFTTAVYNRTRKKNKIDKWSNPEHATPKILKAIKSENREAEDFAAVLDSLYYEGYAQQIAQANLKHYNNLLTSYLNGDL